MYDVFVLLVYVTCFVFCICSCSWDAFLWFVLFVLFFFLCYYFFFFFFFFSSRRRHTRCSRDWSSDVCSSDLGRAREIAGGQEDVIIIRSLRERGRRRLCQGLRDCSRLPELKRRGHPRERRQFFLRVVSSP